MNRLAIARCRHWQSRKSKSQKVIIIIARIRVGAILDVLDIEDVSDTHAGVIRVEGNNMVLIRICQVCALTASIALASATADAEQEPLRGMDAFPPETETEAANGESASPAQAGAESMQKKKVSYSEQQSESGKESYNKYCLECHGANLNDGEFGGPPLRGLRFQNNFGDQPVAALYYYIRELMPPDNPGQLSQKELVDIIAYILDRNGYKAGAAMPTDEAALINLMVAD